MSRSVIKLRQHRLAALAGRRRVRLRISGFCFSGAAASRSLQLGLDLVQRAGRVGMHGHGRIAEHRLGPGGGDGHVRRLARLGIDHRIAEVPEVALDRLVKHLVVADGRLQDACPS